MALTLGVGSLLTHQSAAAEVGSAFNYQGRLLHNGAPAQGSFDLQFNLYRSHQEELPCAPGQTNLAVAVTQGLFSLELDFGQDAFSGEGCWLEIGVRPAGGNEPFVLMHPRQRLAPAPYSIYTLKAESLAGPLPDDQLSPNVARLDANQSFTGEISFDGLVQMNAALNVGGEVAAGSFTGDGQGLSNVTATALSAKVMERYWRVRIPFVTVTNAGNAPDYTGKGAVPYNFRMGKYEINNNQYVAFLNAIGAEGSYQIYNTNMATSVHGGILRSGQPGEYTYEVKPGMGHFPVVWVGFLDVLRFCNWLHHGQPTGPMDATTTEDGAYTLDPAILGSNTVARNPWARYWLPSDDEWYKAAYHQPLESGGIPGDYWPFPTRNFDLPVSEVPPGGDNSINACCATEMKATEVGAYPNTFSYYGAYDLGGNVQEWTEEIIYVTNRRLRGGSWIYNEYYAWAEDLEFDTPDYPADGIGFRVAGAAEP